MSEDMIYTVQKSGPCWTVVGPNLPPNQTAWGAKSRAMWIRDALNANAARIATLEAENKRLAGIVEKLPKTADGVPIVDGMDLYPSPGPAILECHATTQAYWVTIDGQHVVDDPRKFYSTEVAALNTEKP